MAHTRVSATGRGRRQTPDSHAGWASDAACVRHYNVWLARDLRRAGIRLARSRKDRFRINSAHGKVAQNGLEKLPFCATFWSRLW
jgi:hypothetical protein